VWTEVEHCCGPASLSLVASTEYPDVRTRFVHVSRGEIDVFYGGQSEPPAELMVELSGWRKKHLRVRPPDGHLARHFV